VPLGSDAPSRLTYERLKVQICWGGLHFSQGQTLHVLDEQVAEQKQSRWNLLTPTWGSGSLSRREFVQREWVTNISSARANQKMGQILPLKGFCNQADSISTVVPFSDISASSRESLGSVEVRHVSGTRLEGLYPFQPAGTAKASR